ncbi:MAG: hypothetical protein FWD94_02250 [Treponema sp.]|nr:hypothetical protein [Treponema sp.]
MRNFVLRLLIAMLASAAVFAQSDFAFSSKNVFTVDFGPSLIGSMLRLSGAVASSTMGMQDIDTDGFGIGMQYERQLLERLSLAGRFSFLRAGLSVDEEGTRLGANFFSYSAEALVRYYPTGKVFFMGMMLGYANLLADISGEAKITMPDGNINVTELHFSAPRNFLKLGVKLGWRMNFGAASGLVFEPSLGYNIGIGFGDTIKEQMSQYVSGHVGGIFGDTVFYNSIEHFLFAGGPRVTMALGMRF